MEERGRAKNRHVVLNGVRLHYRISGKGARPGRPVVCLPAPKDSSGALVPLVREIGRSRLTFALDLPGQGRSGNPPKGRQDPTWWLTRWLERLGFEHIHLLVVGDSVGTAVDFAQRSAARVYSITALSPPPLDDPHPHLRVGSLLTAAAEAPLRPRLIGSAAAWLRSAAAGDFAEAMEPRDLRRDLAHATAPFFVVYGDNDTLLSRDAAAALARCGNGSAIEIPNAGRRCYLTNPAAIAAPLEALWKGLEQEPNNRPVAVKTQSS